MFKWLWNLFPEDWKFSVAAKKICYMAAKFVVAILTMGKLKSVGSHMTPEQLAQLQTVIGGLTAASLEALQDFARLKWPEVKWL
jgi:hypothetical protein